jgi:hypothetical protein
MPRTTSSSAVPPVSADRSSTTTSRRTRVSSWQSSRKAAASAPLRARSSKRTLTFTRDSPVLSISGSTISVMDFSGCSDSAASVLTRISRSWPICFSLPSRAACSSPRPLGILPAQRCVAGSHRPRANLRDVARSFRIPSSVAVDTFVNPPPYEHARSPQ